MTLSTCVAAPPDFNVEASMSQCAKQHLLCLPARFAPCLIPPIFWVSLLVGLVPLPHIGSGAWGRLLNLGCLALLLRWQVSIALALEPVALLRMSSLFLSRCHFRKIHGSMAMILGGGLWKNIPERMSMVLRQGSLVGGAFPGGPIGPPMSYGPAGMMMPGAGVPGPYPCAGGFGAQGPCGCGGPPVCPGPCTLPGPGVCQSAGVCHGPGICQGPGVQPGPCPFPGYGVCHGVGPPPGCGGFQPGGGGGIPYSGAYGMMMTGWPNAMWNGCGGGMPAGTGVYGDSQSGRSLLRPRTLDRGLLREVDLVEDQIPMEMMMMRRAVHLGMRLGVPLQQRRRSGQCCGGSTTSSRTMIVRRAR